MNGFGSICALFLFLAGLSPVFGAPTPPASVPRPARPDALISLKIDFHNLTAPDGKGTMEPADFQKLLEGVNGLWDQCAVRFSLRASRTVPANRLGVRYRPTAMKHLYQIAGAVAPRDGNGAIPVTLAGNWRVPEGNGNFLNGLGWAFVSAGGIDRLGAMINASRLDDRSGVPIVAHEIAHALSLQHVSGADNLMGGGGPKLTPAQCRRARDFAKGYLGGFRTADRVSTIPRILTWPV